MSDEEARGWPFVVERWEHDQWTIVCAVATEALAIEAARAAGTDGVCNAWRVRVRVDGLAVPAHGPEPTYTFDWNELARRYEEAAVTDEQKARTRTALALMQRLVG